MWPHIKKKLYIFKKKKGEKKLSSVSELSIFLNILECQAIKLISI